MTTQRRPRPVLLAIMDGWGEREASEDIAAGRTTRSPNAKEFVKDLEG